MIAKHFLTLALSGCLAASAMAADPAAPAKAATEQSATNTVCPVSGDKVGEMGKPTYVDYKGKKVALCCKDCVKEFQKDPAKFAALAEKNGTVKK